MFRFLRSSRKVLLLQDADAFWRHCEKTRRIRRTPKHRADAEERLDLRAAEQIKRLLEAEVGPEEGPDPVQRQNWDWNDDRRRSVSVLRRSFRPELIARLQALLVGELEDFEVILHLCEDWGSQAWGHLRIGAGELAVERHVAQAYALAT